MSTTSSGIDTTRHAPRIIIQQTVKGLYNVMFDGVVVGEYTTLDQAIQQRSEWMTELRKSSNG